MMDTSTKGKRPTIQISAGRIWAVAVLGASLSAAAFLLSMRVEIQRDEAEFQMQTVSFLATFQERRNGVEDLLRTLRALFNQNPDLPRGAFRDAIQDLAIRLEGVQALVWVPRVPWVQRGALEKSVRSEGFKDFQITEGDLIHAPEEVPQRAGPREEYFPIVFLEPYKGNEPALGYDLFSVLELQLTLERARETGQISISPSVRFRYERSIMPGIIAAIPVYHPALIPPTVEERQRQIRGFVIAVIVMERMMQQLELRTPRAKLNVMLIDDTAVPSKRMLHAPFDAKSGKKAVRFTEETFRQQKHREVAIAISSRRWLLLFMRNPQWDPGPNQWHPYTLLVGGLLFTTILAQYLRSSLRRTLEIEHEVKQRTAELASTNLRLQNEIRSRVEAQSELAQDRNLLRTLLDNLPDYVFVADSKGRYLMLNEAYRRLLGLKSEAEGLHRSVSEVGPPELAALFSAEFTDTLPSGSPQLDVEKSVLLPDRSEALLSISRLPLRGAGGESERLVVLARDVTEARREEALKQEFSRRLQETQKLESLGLLAGGIAHDFNNLLTSVLGNVELARLDIPKDSSTTEYLEQIQNTALKAADLCKQMLAYSGKGRFVVRRLDLSTLVEETTELLRLSISKKAALNLQLARDLPAVCADPTQVRQILMNLVINASDALEDRPGLIRISTGGTMLQRPDLADGMFAEPIEPGEYVYLEVADNGCGMSPEIKAKIFDPFFTTKFTGRGLGLAAVLGIVRGHKGIIQVQSEPGKGATFRLLLPRAEGPAEKDSQEIRSAGSWRGSGTVLVADDEETIRTFIARALEKAGFSTHLAHDGREAIQMFERNPEGYRAVLLDLTMPQMDGEETFREIRRIRPNAKTLLMSGYSLQEAGDRFAGKGPDGFLQKPFGASALLSAVRELLELPQKE